MIINWLQNLKWLIGKTKVKKKKKKKKKGMAKHLSLFKQYGRLKILEGDQKIKMSRKKLEEYIKGKINAIIFKDPNWAKKRVNIYLFIYLFYLSIYLLL